MTRVASRGFRLRRRVAVVGARADIDVGLMSGYTGPQLTERARPAGVSDVLRKPLVSRDIAEALACAIAVRL